MKFKSAMLTASVVTLMSLSASAQKVTDDLPVYEKVSGLSGNLSSVGSDTLANMMTFWAEEFKRLYPNVNMQIQAAGSSTAPPALTEGTVELRANEPCHEVERNRIIRKTPWL